MRWSPTTHASPSVCGGGSFRTRAINSDKTPISQPGVPKPIARMKATSYSARRVAGARGRRRGGHLHDEHIRSCIQASAGSIAQDALLADDLLKLADQTGLADPGLSKHRHEMRGALTAGFCERFAEKPKLCVSSDKRSA